MTDKRPTLRQALWRFQNAVARRAARSRVTKIRIGGKTIGYRVYSLGNRLLHVRLPETIQANGCTMHHILPGGRGQWGWQYAFEYEAETVRAFTDLVSAGMTVVDVGAHIGYYTLLSARLVGSKGKVFAFEPDPGYHGLLQKNVDVNGFGSFVEAVHSAVGATDGRATLYLGRSTSSSLFHGRDESGRVAEVPMTSLDGFFAARSWPSIDLVKIDIEGAEILALTGMRDLVERDRRLRLIIEANPEYLRAAGSSEDELIALIGELGLTEVKVLSGDEPSYRLPDERDACGAAVRSRPFVNLLCARPSD